MNLTNEQREQLESNGYDVDTFLKDVGNQPAWIKHMGEIESIAELQAIQLGGCASGAYMPAVTYHTALDTMASYGYEVLDYIRIHLGELPQPASDESWAGMAVFYLSYTVELWAGQFDLDGVDWD
jgi:hypothetical protein